MVNVIISIIGLTVLILIGWMAKEFFLATEISIFLRILIGVIIVCSIALLGITIKDKIKQDKKDDFKGVDR
ncbi:MAG: hypothetical protein PHE15_04740 [Dehalococcoidales bacterium]|jgi:uncharacterized protein YacL|nr:hypothetical protein [Dehalococcoidales bacterium]